MDNLLLLQNPLSLPTPEGNPYLKLQLNPQKAVILPLEFTQEVSLINLSRITPIPNQPDYILGLLNQRSRIIWVVDLLKFFNFEPISWENNQGYIVITRLGSEIFGFVIQQIKGVIRFTPDLIKTSQGIVWENLAPYSQGYVDQEEEILPILDLEIMFKTFI